MSLWGCLPAEVTGRVSGNREPALGPRLTTRTAELFLRSSATPAAAEGLFAVSTGTRVLHRANFRRGRSADAGRPRPPAHRVTEVWTWVDRLSIHHDTFRSEAGKSWSRGMVVEMPMSRCAKIDANHRAVLVESTPLRGYRSIWTAHPAIQEIHGWRWRRGRADVWPRHRGRRLTVSARGGAFGRPNLRTRPVHGRPGGVQQPVEHPPDGAQTERGIRSHRHGGSGGGFC
jgi:hypothetical protein